MLTILAMLGVSHQCRIIFLVIDFLVACIRPLATISCEPRQARKGAAVTVDLGAGVWRVWAASILNV